MTNISAPSKKAPAKFKYAGKSKPATPLPPTGASLASRTRGSKRKTTLHPVPAAERRVSYLFFFFFLIIIFFYRKYLLTFLRLTLLIWFPSFFIFLFFSLNIRRTCQLPVLFYLMSLNLRYVSFLHLSFFFLLCTCSFCHMSFVCLI